MSIFLRLSTLALRGVVSGASALSGLEVGDAGLNRVIVFLTDRFSDQSRRLEGALRQSNARAWNALEIALAGESLWKRLTTRAEDRAFAQQVKQFLDAAPLPPIADDGYFRPRCLEELRKARPQLVEGRFDHAELARHAGSFAPFTERDALMDAEWRTCQALAEDVRRLGHERLAWLLGQRPPQGPPLLVTAVQFFFRRAVEEDAELFRGLAFAKLESIADGQQLHLQALADRMDDLLAGVHATVAETHANVLDLRQMMHGQSEQIRQLGEEMSRALARLEMERGAPAPRHSLSLRDDRERRLVRALVDRYRALTDAQRQELPALLHGLGKLGFASGDFREAVHDFQQVAQMVDDPQARAEAHFSAYRAALEEGLFDVALGEFLEAVRLDGRRWLPFPITKYVPERILGAGGFGVAFLCRHKYLAGQVVVKTLQSDGLEMDAGQVFREAHLLRQLDHPSIIRITDCGFAGEEDPSRPFLVMDYFDGLTLNDHVQRHGPLSVRDLLAVARAVAEGLRAAHDRGILHRDIKPANVLVCKKGAEWGVKLIDFGLALKQEILDASATRRGAARTVIGRTVEGTLDYAAPEQLGRLDGVPTSPASDVYGLGRTLCHAVCGTPQPLPRHFRNLPDGLVSLLEDCIEEKPAMRPRSCADVLARLSKLDGSSPTIALPPAPPAAAAEWYYIRNGQQSGPVTYSALRDLVVTRQLPPGEPVWKAGMREWVLASVALGMPPEVPLTPLPVPVVTIRPTPVPDVLVAQPAEPDWLVSVERFCEATQRLWASGKVNGFAPTYQPIARQQAKADYLREIRGLARFIEDNGYPFFQDEALIGTGKTMALTTYRMLITTPQRRVLCLSLAEMDSYAFEGAQGTWVGFFVGSDLKIGGKFGRYHWSGEELEDLFFPMNEYVAGVLALAEWRRLPKPALRALSLKRDEVTA